MLAAIYEDIRLWPVQNDSRPEVPSAWPMATKKSTAPLGSFLANASCRKSVSLLPMKDGRGPSGRPSFYASSAPPWVFVEASGHCAIQQHRFVERSTPRRFLLVANAPVGRARKV